MKDTIYQSLDSAVQDLFGNDCVIEQRKLVSGGDINEARALMLSDGTVVFMKSNTAGFLPGFAAEAQGLEAIRNTGKIGVPKVLAYGVDGSDSFLLMEYIAGGKQIKDFWETFAVELAAMHSVQVSETFGFPHDNWIGDRKQKNTPYDSWISFFRDCRLKPQFVAAGRYFDHSDHKRIERLMTHLEDYLIEPERPSLVHGDLWAGNMITGNDGKGWLIDPAAYYGHPEVDLAMTELFGGFSYRFYEVYKDAGNLDSGYKDRRDLYNLYQLLNHLNIFGRGYLSSVKQILARYG